MVEMVEKVSVRMCGVGWVQLHFKNWRHIGMYRKQFRLGYVLTKCMMRVYSSLFGVGALGVCSVRTAGSSTYLSMPEVFLSTVIAV